MISSMHRRVAGFVTLLGLAVAATSRPALAQQTDGEWFDNTAPSAPPGNAPSAPPGNASPSNAPSAPPPGAAPQQEPDYGPPGVTPASDPGAQPGPQDDVPETDPRALSEFRPTLDPYGTWVEDQKYGTVWVPSRDAVGDDFAPYVSSGHWALTEDGDWTWQSDYPFGGVVFHYGRWVWVPGTGWAWVAGRRYANAWVNWRVPTDDYGYLGWAPMPPAWGWYGGSAISLWWYPPAPYVFCPSLYAFSYHVHSYIVHDPYVIHDVAAHTRNYSSAAGGGHIAATPRVLSANSPAPRGPTLQSAHISASAAPASRMASGSSFSGARSNFSGSLRSNPYVRNDSSYSQRPYSASSSYRGARPYSNPSSYARPSSNYSRPSNTTYPAAPQRSYYSAPRSYYSPSSSSVVSRPYPAPAMHYSAPALHYSAPARSYSAPSRSYSAPSFHSNSRR
jgi:hypothetical protein